MSAVADALRAARMSDVNAAAGGRAFAAALAAWEASRTAGVPPRLLFVPGRVEVLGKHTDYAGGSTLTCAAERGACVVYSPRRDARVRVVDALLRTATTCALLPDVSIRQGHWSAYPATVARRVARNFGPGLSGVDLALYSTLPMSAGLSSSSTLITATFLALSAVNALDTHPAYVSHIGSHVDLASYLGSVENGQAFGSLTGDHGVGTFGGSEDHTAMLCSEAGRIGHFAFQPGRRLASLPVPDGFTFVIAVSGIAATKTGNAKERYNRAAALAAAILQRWRTTTGGADPTLQAAVGSAPDATGRLRALLEGTRDGAHAAADLVRRLDHFVLENQVIVPAAARALAAGDVVAFGEIARESQLAAEQLLGNQVPETVALARVAREAGAAAASAFGAGFGGSVWALVEQASAETFLGRWRERYHRFAAPPVAGRSMFFVSGAGPATIAVQLAGHATARGGRRPLDESGGSRGTGGV